MLQPRPYFSLKKLAEVDGFSGVDDVEVPAAESDLLDVYSYLMRPVNISAKCACAGDVEPQVLDYSYNENELQVECRCLNCGVEFVLTDILPEYGDEIRTREE